MGSQVGLANCTCIRLNAVLVSLAFAVHPCRWVLPGRPATHPSHRSETLQATMGLRNRRQTIKMKISNDHSFALTFIERNVYGELSPVVLGSGWVGFWTRNRNDPVPPVFRTPLLSTPQSSPSLPQSKYSNWSYPCTSFVMMVFIVLTLKWVFDTVLHNRRK